MRRAQRSVVDRKPRRSEPTGPQRQRHGQRLLLIGLSVLVAAAMPYVTVGQGEAASSVADRTSNVASKATVPPPFPTPVLLEHTARKVLAGEMYPNVFAQNGETVSFYNPQAHLERGEVVLHVQSGWDGGGCPRPYRDAQGNLHFNRDQIIAFKPSDGPASDYVPYAYDFQGSVTIQDFRNSRLTPCIEYWAFGLGSVVENFQGSGYAMFFDLADARLETNNDDKFRWIYMAQSADGVYPDVPFGSDPLNPNWTLVLDSTALDIDIADMTVTTWKYGGAQEFYMGFLRFGVFAEKVGRISTAYNHATGQFSAFIMTAPPPNTQWTQAVNGVLDFLPYDVMDGYANDIVLPPDLSTEYDLVFSTKSVPLGAGGGCPPGQSTHGKAITYRTTRSGIYQEVLGHERILYSLARPMPLNTATGVMFPALIGPMNGSYYMFTSYDTECNGHWGDLDIWYSEIH